jgi:histidinol-phosphatase
MKSCLPVAIAAANASAELIRQYYRGDFEIEIKPDQTPVTVADREAEEIIRNMILDAFPDHGFFGEEGGRTQEDAEFLWLVDPIDGTKSFVAGYGMFSTQIALMHQGELILGVSSAPAHNELAWAVKGDGAHLQDKPIHMRKISSLQDAAISTGNIQTLAASGNWEGLGRILASANRTRGYGDYYHYHRLAAGQIDAVIESDVNILDIAALAVIVRESGGIFTDLEGKPPALETRSVLAAGPTLHPQLLEMLNSGAAL